MLGDRGDGLAGGRLAVVGAGQDQDVLPVGGVSGGGQVAREVTVGVNRQLTKGVADAGVALAPEEDRDLLAGVEALGVEGEGLGLALRTGGDLVGAGDTRVVEVDLRLLLLGDLGHLGLVAVGHAAGANGPPVSGGGGGCADGLDERRQVEVGGPAAVLSRLGLDDVGNGAVRCVQRDADGGLLPGAAGSRDGEGRVGAGGGEGLLLSDLEAAASAGLAGGRSGLASLAGRRAGLSRAAGGRGGLGGAAGGARAVAVGAVGENGGGNERGSGHCGHRAGCGQGASKTHVSS